MKRRKTAELGLVCLATFALLGAEHLVYTWRPALRGRVRPPWTYVAGVLSLTAPWAALMALWGRLDAVVAWGFVTASGGLAVIGGYHFLGLRFLRYENELLKRYLERDDGDEGQR